MARHLDLTSMRLFLAVCEEGSITRAADRVGIAASAISKRISEMEKHAGLQLLTRGRSRTDPTRAGQLVIRRGKHVFTTLEKLSEELQAVSCGAGGQVSIYANYSAISHFLPDEIALMSRRFPDIQVDFCEQFSEACHAAVADGIAEIGIVSESPKDTHLQVKAFRRDRLCVISPAGHWLERAEQVTFDDCGDEVHIGLHRRSYIDRLLDRQAVSRGKVRKVGVYSQRYEALCKFVAAGMGIAIVPIWVARSYENSLRYSIADLDETWATRQLSLVFDENAISSAGRKVVDHLCHATEAKIPSTHHWSDSASPAPLRLVAAA